MKQTKCASDKGAFERWLLCNGSSGDKQKVAADLCFDVELKVFFFLGFLLELLRLSFLSLVYNIQGVCPSGCRPPWG